MTRVLIAAFLLLLCLTAMFWLYVAWLIIQAERAERRRDKIRELVADENGRIVCRRPDGLIESFGGRRDD